MVKVEAPRNQRGRALPKRMEKEVRLAIAIGLTLFSLNCTLLNLHLTA